MHPDPSVRTIESLIPIWERALAKSPIGFGDNFFALGGDACSAARLFAEIAAVHGRKLPPWVIYQAPTVQALAAVIDAPTPVHLPPLIELRPGSDALPVFMAHGMGGNILEFFELVRHLRTARGIYGLQAKGSDGSEAPLTRIEHMARYHLEAIKKIQPHGPYSLVGYSLGGLVVLEMVRLLSASGEGVALVVMIDSYPPTSRQGLWELVRQVATQAAYCVSDIVRPLFYETAAVRLVRVHKQARFSDFLAWSRYRPRFYNGEIKFVRAADSDYPDPATIWPNFAAKLKLEIVPGDHHTLLSQHSENLARLLSYYLESAPEA